MSTVGYCTWITSTFSRSIFSTNGTTYRHHINGRLHPRFLRLQASVINESKETKSTTDDNLADRSEVDKLVDGLNFGELCNEFECLSSPAVESTARQLARDILELREGNRALGSYAINVKYKDPVRSFTGRDKYKRLLWATGALDNPSATVQEMAMLSTSVLNIKWLLKGKPKNPIFALGGELLLRVTSKFTLNQISGQVIEHEELWDVSLSPSLAQAYFWISRRYFSSIESGKDTIDFAKNITSKFSREKENVNEVYPDPLDPTKFFQRDDGFMRDAYQIALFVAIVYFVVQFLKITI